MPLKQLDDWGDGETVLVARGKVSPEGERFDVSAAALAICDTLEDLAGECPDGYYLKRVKCRRELRPDKGRAYYVECVFARIPERGNR